MRSGLWTIALVFLSISCLLVQPGCSGGPDDPDFSGPGDDDDDDDTSQPGDDDDDDATGDDDDDASGDDDDDDDATRIGDDDDDDASGGDDDDDDATRVGDDDDDDVTPSPTPISSRDDDGDGYGSATDCDDRDATVHPGAAEACDGLDNDCDGVRDDGLPQTYLQDADDDGFGVTTTMVCAPVRGYVRARGDCDDQAAEVHPGAIDTAGDGLDADCGGSDDAEPYVGLNSGGQPSIQAALDKARDGAIIWVGQGTWQERDISFRGLKVTLISTLGFEETRIDGLQKGRLMVLKSGETAATLIDGFTFLSGAVSGENGAAVSIDNASPTFRDCVFTANIATGGRGAVALRSSSASFIRCTFRNNTGGALYASGSQPVISGSSFEDNTGGGAWLESSQGSISDSSFTRNQIEGNGGGLMLVGSSPTLTGCTLAENVASREDGLATAGGGIYLEASSRPTLTGCRIERNVASEGGGLYVKSSSPALNGCTVQGNRAVYAGRKECASGSCAWVRRGGRGGGLYLTGSSPSLAGTRLIDNQAEETGGGLYLVASSNPQLSNTLLTLNGARYLGGGLYVAGSSPRVDHCTLVENHAGYGGGIYMEGPSRPVIKDSILAYNAGTNLYLRADGEGGIPEPSISYSAIFNAVGSSYSLITTLDASNLEEPPAFVHFTPNRDSSDDDLHLGLDSPLRLAASGSTEMGMYGGTGADRSYYQDLDKDTLYDGWERAMGLDPTRDDKQQDPDGDGLTNASELYLHSHPKLEDSDEDGVDDELEVSGGSDPADWFSRPAEAVARARVPQDFATVQAAIDRVGQAGEIEVGPGEWRESLVVYGKQLVLHGAAGADETILTGVDGPVIRALWSELEIEGLTLAEGRADMGGGLSLVGVDGTLTSSRLEDNLADYYGGGIYMAESAVDLDNCVLTDNLASSYYADARGGAIYLHYSSPEIRHTRFTANLAGAGTDSGDGSAGSSTDFDGAGGAVYLSSSSPVFANVLFTLNQSLSTAPKGGAYGGAVYVEGSSPWFLNTVVASGVVSASSGIQLGGGVYISGSASKPAIESSILGFNLGYNVYNDKGLPVVLYSILYNAGALKNHNLGTLDVSCLTVEPKFLAYSGNQPTDFHLAANSAAVNGGSSTVQDTDGTRADMGIYGNQTGGEWDLDGDGVPDWFWPGPISSPPAGYAMAEWDCDDQDASRSRCDG